MAFQVVQRYNSSELRMTIVYRPWWHGCWSPKITVPRWLPRCWTLWIALRSPSYKRFTLKENDRWPVSYCSTSSTFVATLAVWVDPWRYRVTSRGMAFWIHHRYHCCQGTLLFLREGARNSLERQKQWKLHRFLRWISMISVGKQIESSINPWTSTVWRRGRGISSRRPKTCSEL